MYIDGIRKKVNVFCMRLCYSCDIFVMAFYRQNEESFLEGHIKAFEFFKGVSGKLIFDNAKVAMKEGFGKYAKPPAFLNISQRNCDNQPGIFKMDRTI
ncbi:hypothetical protein M1N80_04130 [Peptococcaceae bacterium]|nr:hypothetical protein [Peptococcaceae bacterium]